MERNKRPKVAVARGEDRISALLDDVLGLIVSRLPSDDAVLTSVLARRWRHLWTSASAVRVPAHRSLEVGAAWTPWALNNFVTHLLLLRGGAPADEFEVTCGELDYAAAAGVCFCHKEGVRDHTRSTAASKLARFVGLWIRYALAFCRGRTLRFSVRTSDRRLQLAAAAHLVSSVLTTVEFADVSLEFPSKDLSGCPALEDLKMSTCKIHVERILSQSWRHLASLNATYMGRLTRASPHLASSPWRSQSVLAWLLFSLVGI